MIQEEKRWQEEEAAEAAEVHEEAAEAVECVPVQAEEEVVVEWEDVVLFQEEEDQVMAADQDREDQDQEDQDHMEVTIDHQDHQDIITIIITMVEHTTVVEEAADAQVYWQLLF